MYTKENFLSNNFEGCNWQDVNANS